MADFGRDEFIERIRKLQDFLATRDISAAILNQNSDLYYYTGSVQPLYLLVPASGEPVVMARKAINRIREEVRHLQFEPFYNTKDLVRIIGKTLQEPIKKIGLTLDTTSYATVIRWQQLCGGAEVVDLSLDIRILRIIKSSAEIAIQTKAGEVMDAVPVLVKKSFQPGMTELELSAALENHFRLNGHAVLVRCRREGIEMGFGVCSAGINSLAGTKFDGICAGVGGAAAVPYGASKQPIPKNVPVILDYAFNYQGYHLDQTRMFCWGEPAEEVKKAYLAMLQVEQAIIKDLKPNKIWSEVYENALNLAVKLGYEKEFMGLGDEKVRFVGHGVGLELDEPPFLAPKMEYPLAAGMVVAIEPKVSLPGIGVVGIEDTLVIGDQDCNLLTTASNELLVIP